MVYFEVMLIGNLWEYQMAELFLVIGFWLYSSMNLPISSINSCFNQYLLECEYTKKLRPETMKSYRDVIHNFLALMPEIENTTDLKPFVVHEFFKRLSERAKGNNQIMKTSSIRTYYNKLMVFFRWLESNNIIEYKSLSSKVTKPPNPIYDDEKSLHESEVAKIIASISMHNFDSEFMLKRDLVIINLLLYTGIRRGELLGLRVQDVDFTNRILFVNGKTSKSKKSRYIPLHFTLLTLLKVYLKMRQIQRSKSECLIVSTKADKGLTQYGLKHWVTKYNRLSGVSFHLHQFRHTFACNLAKKGANIMSIKSVLGHSSTQMTERYLRSIQSEDTRLPIEQLLY